MRTFVRISLLGNAFLDLACILLLLAHGPGNQPHEATAAPQPAEGRATVDDNDPLGVIAFETPSVQCKLPESLPAGFPAGRTMRAEWVQRHETPVCITTSEVGRLNWRFESETLGEGAYPRPLP